MRRHAKHTPLWSRVAARAKDTAMRALQACVGMRMVANGKRKMAKKKTNAKPTFIITSLYHCDLALSSILMAWPCLMPSPLSISRVYCVSVSVSSTPSSDSATSYCDSSITARNS